MKKIALISCVSKKLPHKAPARELYTSPLFKKNLAYAQQMKPDAIFILSAKYGLVDLDREIEPYDLTLNTMKATEIKAWADRVLEQLAQRSDLSRDTFVFLAGQKYRQYLLPSLHNYEIPMQGLSIGKQLQALSKPQNAVSHICHELHRLFNSLTPYRFPFDRSLLPKNGIYILFEDGEHAHGTNRIVRIGTHTGDNQLPPRLEQHFLTENKDRSIFRKNIGRALLCREHDPFLESWQLDLTTSEAKKKYLPGLDVEKQQQIERQVSQYIRRHLWFVVFPVPEKAKRLEWESKIISTVSRCNDCRPTATWLGNHSPKDKIRQSGLWIVNELYKTPLSESELSELRQAYGIAPP